MGASHASFMILTNTTSIPMPCTYQMWYIGLTQIGSKLKESATCHFKMSNSQSLCKIPWVTSIYFNMKMPNMLIAYGIFHFWKGIYYMSLWPYPLELQRHSWLSQIKANVTKIVHCLILIDTHTCALPYNYMHKICGIMCFGLCFVLHIISSKCDRRTNRLY